MKSAKSNSPHAMPPYLKRYEDKIKRLGYSKSEAREIARGLAEKRERIEARFGGAVRYYLMTVTPTPEGGHRFGLIVPTWAMTGAQRDIAETMALESGGGVL